MEKRDGMVDFSLNLIRWNIPSHSLLIPPNPLFEGQVRDQSLRPEKRRIRFVVNPINRNVNRCLQVYQHLAERTRSLHRFRLIPYPDWMNASANEFQEGLYVKSRQACR